MTTVANNAEWLQAFKAELAEDDGDSSDHFDHLRRQAIDALKSEPLPFRTMERWRYTPVDALFKLPLNIAITGAANDIEHSDLFNPEVDAYRFVVSNGHALFLGNAADLPEGVTFTTMHKGMQENQTLASRYAGTAMRHQGAENTVTASPVQKDSKLFQYLNQSATPDGVFIHVAEGIQLEKPVEIVFVKTGDQADLLQSHNLVVLEKNAAMTLIEKHVDEKTSRSFCNNQSELIIDDHASMKHYYLQQQETSSWHRDGIHRIQAADSQYQGWFGCCGSQWCRLEMNAFFTGENALSEVQGIQLAMHGQVNDIHLDMHHDEPNCHSEQHFRGLVAEKSKIVFDGNITVSQDAQKTIAHLSDNNLMLTRNAEVDAKPQLEIYADDVQCSHGTSIGELDEQQVFYLRSRGISEERARRLLSIGYVSEIIEKIELDAFRHEMQELLERQLQASGAKGALGVIE
ncbi:MAG: Fe-S cluster assembly protein SufD [Gammaproteobacteria bacterium]|nr:Fe-S cluster assembly protein SufD [Gammaproteobacteria bacterium]